MNDDIKRALEAIYSVKDGAVTEAEPVGAQAAAAHMGQDVDIKGTFNAKAFGALLGMDPSEAALLNTFLNKHKQGMPPSRNEIMAAADVFRALVDADPKITNQALMLLRRVQVQAEESVEVGSVEQQINQEIAESIRITKEGVEECWGDMMPNAATGQGEQMTVNISMPNKQISVTTDSADEIMNVLKLAGIAVGEPAAEEEPVVTMMPVAGAEGPEAAMVGAPGVTAPEGEAEESEKEESEKEEKKEESVEPQGPAVEEQDAFTMAAAAAAREGKTEFEFPPGSGKKHPVKIEKDTAHKMGEGQEESARILKLAGLDEAKFANAPADTEGEAKVYDKLPSAPGDGGGKPEYGTRQSNLGGENPMALKTLDLDMEESFQVAMGEYRKFVAENIMAKKKVSIKEGQQIAEGGMSDADAIIQDIIRGDIGITDVMNHPKTPAEKYVADILSQIYIEVQEDNPLMHPDDDFEDMLPMIQDRLADQYGSKVEGVTKK